ncbi:hypothetical protein M3J09_011409 [Ascochyta lentis]
MSHRQKLDILPSLPCLVRWAMAGFEPWVEATSCGWPVALSLISALTLDFSRLQFLLLLFELRGDSISFSDFF